MRDREREKMGLDRKRESDKDGQKETDKQTDRQSSHLTNLQLVVIRTKGLYPVVDVLELLGFAGSHFHIIL